jgi:hypothetical protein
VRVYVLIITWLLSGQQQAAAFVYPSQAACEADMHHEIDYADAYLAGKFGDKVTGVVGGCHEAVIMTPASNSQKL